MNFKRRNIYPDSDFGFTAVVSELPILDLSSLELHQVQGDKVVKLADLEKLGFVIKQ